MNVEKTSAHVTNVNPRKEPGEDGQVLASDMSVTFSVPRKVIDALIPGKSFTSQFYSGEDTRLECVCPIVFGERVEGLRITLHIGLKPLVFEGARIAAGMKLTPKEGQHIPAHVKCWATTRKIRDHIHGLDHKISKISAVIRACRVLRNDIPISTTKEGMRNSAWRMTKCQGENPRRSATGGLAANESTMPNIISKKSATKSSRSMVHHHSATAVCLERENIS
ncbi:MAG: hypothetical protein IIB77_06895 [Proteobacteria bacterium]|nr:hypothetical protein [Pseudomonadota bacterium]